MGETQDYPSRWEPCHLGDLISLNYGKALPAKTRDPNGGYEVFGSNGAVGVHSEALIPGPAIIVGRKGSAGEVEFSREPCWPIDTTYFVHPPDGLDIRFTFFLLKSLGLDRLDRSTAVPGLNRDDAYALTVGLPPSSEQQRIVEKIETLFARLDKGEEAVREVQKLLTRYRQSVLKSVVTGQLTADWRAERNAELDDGEQLIERILEKRSAEWTGRGAFKRPDGPNIDKLPNLPSGWAWARMEQLFDVYGGATPSRREPENWGGEIPWVSSGEVAFCRIDDTNEKITEQGYASCSTKLHPVGTVLIAMIGEGKTRGQAAILDVPACNNQNAAAIRVSETEVPPEYVYFYLVGNYEANRLKGQGGNQPALSGAKVKNFEVPVCSVGEMEEIVKRVEERLFSIEAIEQWCETELKRSASLRRSILKEAFAGRLVPQDPADEPASVLLARIAEAKAPTKKTRRKVQA